MKIKCFLCEIEYEEGEPFEMHYVDGDCFIDTDEKIRKMQSMSKLLFKIHEKIAYYETRAKEDTVGDYRCDYSGKSEILKSLLENDSS